MADKHNIPKCKMHSNSRLLPDYIVWKITQGNNLRSANTCDPALKLQNEEILPTYTNTNKTSIEYITTLFNLPVTTCQIPVIWKSPLTIPIPKPGKDSSYGTSYRKISLLCPAAKVLESLLLPSINKYILPAPEQDGFRPEHSTTSALLQLPTDIAMGFNQRKPPDPTVCVAVDLSAAFDTVCHNKLLSKINNSQVPPNCYLGGRQAKICFRGVKSTSRKVNTGIPQGSELSPSLFRFYTADMLIPTDPVKQVC